MPSLRFGIEDLTADEVFLSEEQAGRPSTIWGHALQSVRGMRHRISFDKLASGETAQPTSLPIPTGSPRHDSTTVHHLNDGRKFFKTKEGALHFFMRKVFQIRTPGSTGILGNAMGPCADPRTTLGSIPLRRLWAGGIRKAIRIRVGHFEMFGFCSVPHDSHKCQDQR